MNNETDTNNALANGATVSTTDSTDPEYWSKRYAGILRGQWDNWKQQYQPFEQYYANLLLDPKKNADLKGQSMAYVTNAADQAYQSGLRDLADTQKQYGYQLDPQEQASQQRKLALTSLASKAKGMTDMAGYLRDRDNQMMSGGLAYARTT